ncbi:MAG: hypothetical protein Q8K36_04205 [Alphaproteobacteria bacterium]|nr:hypothetical protein [Alphaproteobacteria bacterium]
MNNKSMVFLMFTAFQSMHYAIEMGLTPHITSTVLMQMSEFIAHSIEVENNQIKREKYIDADGNFLIDYSHMGVCDYNNSSSLHHAVVFETIKNDLLCMVEQRPIIMNFHGNYLTSEGIKALVIFIKNNELLKAKLIHLDISNNRFRSDVLPDLKDLLTVCPQLIMLNVAINYISSQDLKDAELTDSRVFFTPY